MEESAADPVTSVSPVGHHARRVTGLWPDWINTWTELVDGLTSTRVNTTNELLLLVTNMSVQQTMASNKSFRVVKLYSN